MTNYIDIKKKNTKTYEKIINFKENRIQNMNKL